MDKIRVLMVGSAFSADLHMDGYARFKDKMEIVAICSKNPEQIEALTTRYGITGYQVFEDFDEALEQVECDVVDICLPNFLHHAVCMKALAKNRHVICEKPLATTVEDAREMVAKAKEVGRQIYYAEDWLFAPAVLRALDILEEGAIGKPLYMRARECHSGSHSPFAQKIEFCGGGTMVHLGIHPVAFALALKNNQWTELVAMTSGGSENNLIHTGMEGEDWSTAIIRFADGTSATLEANYVTMGGMEDIIDFYGDKGCLHVDLNFTSAVSCFSVPGVNYTVEKAEVTTGWSRPAVDEKYNLGYVGEIGHFLDCCRTGSPAKVGLRGEDGLAALEVVQLIYQSAREGRKIINPRLGEKQ
ncbi:Gfo/Idh/MocA family oxidoreductase [Oscillospiraceae bacterium MB08-C2-2]|nr:Gfo/Idh/MocA family oxidoreductase [Oscillospiraceae bacterium MB08-C2-2]